MFEITKDGVPGRIAARGWPLVLATTVVVGVGALLWSLFGSAAYRATAQLYLTRTHLDASLTGTPNATAHADAAATASTVATLAELPDVAGRTLRRVGSPSSLKARVAFLKGASTQLPASSPGMVTFAVVEPSRRQAVRLVNAWARESNAYRVELDARAIRVATRDVEARLAELKSAGQIGSELYRSLVDKQQQLLTVLTLQTESATLVREATDAQPARRGPVSSAIFGALAGALLGLGLVFAWSLLVPRSTTGERIGPQATRTEHTDRLAG